MAGVYKNPTLGPDPATGNISASGNWYGYLQVGALRLQRFTRSILAAHWLLGDVGRNLDTDWDYKRAESVTGELLDCSVMVPVLVYGQ